MMPENATPDQLQAQQKDHYSISCLDDEIRADRLCSLLLKQFHRFQLEECHLDPLEAGSLAAGADYFLRDYMISNQQANIFSTSAGAIRQFAGYWYIISNLEPNMSELINLLKGTAAFFQFCAEKRLIENHQAEAIGLACRDLDHYRRRIESFHEISGGGYSAWEKNAP
jgi:hypothetical protein